MPIAAWRDGALESHLQAIAELLQQHASWWRPQAFTFLQMPWESAHPQLSQRLRALPIAQAEQLAADEHALAELLGEFIPGAPTVLQACSVPELAPLQSLSTIAEARDVPGRKWRQLVEFAARLPADKSAVVEWCAGKAHLGRLVARTGARAVTALERDAALVAAGRSLAQRENLPVSFAQIDVMSAAAVRFIHAEHDVVALHACGDLHLRLLRVCGERKPAALMLAPCCYHLTQASTCLPLSQCGLRSGLALSRDDLRTAVQGSVTAPARVQQQRKQLQAWRLGYDLLQRELRGGDYLPTPSLPASVLHAGFAAFCRQLAQHGGVQLPPALDYPHYEAAGVERLRLVTALDLPRLLFRRALEVWLVLDRAVFLREAGYAVEVGTFCARALTPRNLLIRAHARGGAA